MEKVEFKPIGIIHTPFTKTEGMPIQPSGGRGIKGKVEINPEYREGLTDLEKFSHAVLIYHFHRSDGYKLKIKPFLDTEKRGLFATRAPRRPNPIGISVVKINKIEDGVIHIENIDILDGTPLLDIKPYIPDFENFEDIKTGWLEGKSGKAAGKRSDDRFK